MGWEVIPYNGRSFQQDVENSQEGVENFRSKYICLCSFFAAECRRRVITKRPNDTTGYLHAVLITGKSGNTSNLILT